MRGAADIDNDGLRDVIVQNAANGTALFEDINAVIFTGWGSVAGAISMQWTSFA